MEPSAGYNQELLALDILLERGIQSTQQGRHVEAVLYFSRALEQLSPDQFYYADALDNFIQSHTRYRQAQEALHTASKRFVKADPMPSNNRNWSPWKSYYQSYGKRWIGRLNLAPQPSRLKTPLNPLLHNHHNCHLPTSMMVNHLNLHIHSVKTQISYHRCTLLVLVASR